MLNDGVKNLLYVVGGSTGCGPRTATMEAYDPDSDTWSFKASMPGGPRSTMGVAVIDNTLYVVGGLQADSGPHAGLVAVVEAYDPTTDTWTTRRSLPGVRFAMAIGAIGGRIYVAGGGNEFGGLTSVYVYDPATDSWSARANIPVVHYSPASAVLNGRLYVIAGQVGTSFSDVVHVYDPVADGWGTDSPLPVVKTSAPAATVNGLVYVMGGTDGATPQSDAFTLDAVDTTPPVTTAMPVVPPNGNGWHNTNVTVMLEAADASGVQSITYSLTGAQTGGATLAGARVAVPVTAEGITTLTYQAVDATGNVEAQETLTVRIDRTAPLVVVPSDIVAPATTSAGAVVSFTVQPSDALSGVVSTQVSPLLSGMVFPLGTTHETVTVLDAAGNGSIAGFDVTVVPGRPNISVTGGHFDADGNAHPATAAATDHAGTPVAGAFTIAYTPGGTPPMAPGHYSATATFDSGDPAFLSRSPWTTRASDIVRSFASAGVINGRIYVVGVPPEGAASATPLRLTEFDPATNNWSVRRNAPVSRNQAGSAVIGSRLFVAGGCVFSDCGSTTNILAAYDAADDTWSTLAAMPFARNNVAMAAIGDRLYVAGGANPFTATDNLQIYDRHTNTWTAGATLPVAVWQAAGAAFNGRLYVIGGLDGAGQYRNLVQVYDPASNTWSSAAGMPTARIALAAVVANGRIYAVGGSHQISGVTGVIESFDPITNAWTVESSLPTARFALSAGVIDGVLHAIGGGSIPNYTGINEALDLALTTHVTIDPLVSLESITVAPSSATLLPGDTHAFLATGHFSDGSSRVLMTAGGGPLVRWESGNPAIASVNEFGLVRANTPGIVTIRASAGSVICPADECATVTVADMVAPALSLPNDMTVEAFSASGQAVTWFASAQDSVDGLRAVTCDPPSGSAFPFGTTSVRCSASDSSGNVATGRFNVTVQDTNPPWLALPNDPSTREAMGPGGALVTYSATATDSVDGPLVPSCSPASGSQLPFGPTLVTCSVSDARGNSATGTFTVVVQDTTAPFLSIPGMPQVREATNSGGAIVTYSASAHDTVSGPIQPTCTPSSGAQFPFGSTTVQCSATDTRGNVRNGSFTVTVQDTTAPILGLPNSPQTRQATSAAGAIVTYTATANDTADGPIIPSCSPASGSQLPLGATTVNCSATDVHGNTRTGSFAIHVVDTNGPFVSTPGSLTAQATSPSGAAVSFTVTAYDTVDGTLPVSCNPPSGSTFPLGSTQVTCTSTDSRGNTGSGLLQVNVVPSSPAVTIVTPSSDALIIGNVEVIVETQSAAAMQWVIINGSPAAFRGTTPTGASRWRRVVPAGPGTLTVSVLAIDVAGRRGTASLTIDNDGIAVAINPSPNTYSSDFGDGVTSGRIVRSGGAHVTAAPNGGAIAIAQVYPGRAEVHPCQGGAKYVVLDAPGDRADVTCNGATVTVRATGAAGSTIELVKQAVATRYVTTTRCHWVPGSFFRSGYSVCYPVTVPVTYTYWYSIPLMPGQGASTGSPVAASPDNTGPIRVTLLQMADDGFDIPVASFDLDPGESADVSVTPSPAREDVIGIASLAGSIDAEVGGIPRTIAEGTTVAGTLDLTPPVSTVPQAKQLLMNILRNAAAGRTSAACGQLEAFLNMVSAQAGHKLTQPGARSLIQMATDAGAALGCR